MSSILPSSIIVNQNILDMEYAVRGPIPQRAAELRKQGMITIPCHIGNPQALGQKPITFYRQVLSLVEEPSQIRRERKLNLILKNNVEVFRDFQDRDIFSDYVLNLADQILANMENGLGPYSESKGPQFIREAVAKYIDKRDRVDSVNGIDPIPFINVFCYRFSYKLRAFTF